MPTFQSKGKAWLQEIHRRGRKVPHHLLDQERRAGRPAREVMSHLKLRRRSLDLEVATPRRDLRRDHRDDGPLSLRDPPTEQLGD